MLWFRGITVVTAAGNDGPRAGTIHVPGNDPYVVTVGAMDETEHHDGRPAGNLAIDRPVRECRDSDKQCRYHQKLASNPQVGHA